jgi:hypothetical protein
MGVGRGSPPVRVDTLRGLRGGETRLEKHNMEWPTVSTLIFTARIRSFRTRFSLVFPSLSDRRAEPVFRGDF